MTLPASRLTELDLRLYLAGALPPGKRLLFRWALALDPALRARLREARAADAAFRRGGMPRLRERLFPEPRRASAAPSPRAFGFFRPGFAPALAGAVCALAFTSFLIAPGLKSAGGAYDAAMGNPEAIAKGRGLGVALLVKGDSVYRVERQAARVRGTDTLQVLPLGTEPQHLVLLGWDARQGLVRLFPRAEGPAPRVSRTQPPPALLPQDGAENRLICVTATGPFTVAQAEAALRAGPFQPGEGAPAARLSGGLYLQIFSIAVRPEGI
jgi:hypothetical protein